MKATASGRFDVKLAPDPLSETAAASGLGRLWLTSAFTAIWTPSARARC